MSAFPVVSIGMPEPKDYRDNRLKLLLHDAGASVKEPERCAAFYREGFRDAEDFYRKKMEQMKEMARNIQGIY